MHPKVVVQGEDWPKFDIWLTNIKVLARNMVAIVECGLDSTDNPTNTELQKQINVFESQLKLVEKKQLLSTSELIWQYNWPVFTHYAMC